MFTRLTVRTILCWLSLLGVCVAMPALALDGHWYAGAGYGKGLATLGNSNPEVTYYYGYLTDAYPLTNSQTSAGVANVSGGYEWPAMRSGWPAIAVGVGLYTTPKSYNYQGQVNETALGSESKDYYDYQFQLSSTRLMVETTFTWTVAQQWRPYGELGIGVALNTVSDYSESVASSNTHGYVTTPPFESKTTSNVAYQVGVGLGYDFNFDDINTFDADSDYVADSFQHERLKIGYRWVDSGSASTGTRSIDPYNSYNIDLGTVKTQELYISFTHYF